ncbi:hypothetical protein B0H14DRAFT_3650006 [Mycena olivaceomarginata]|nr:hypothetical protein B0H14DRAFT_3650006 [Mycena olivaceomarginata]
MDDSGGERKEQQARSHITAFPGCCEILKGVESHSHIFHLKTVWNQATYGVFLANGDLAQVEDDFARHVARHAATAFDSETPAAEPSTSEPAMQLAPEAAAVQELYALTWGPTLVPVDGPDLSGTLVLSHAIFTKPALDFEYAQLLYDAGGDVNNRNRCGGTAAHEIAQIWTPRDKSVVHAWNVDVADGDGITVRCMATRTKSLVPRLSVLVAASDRDRVRRECCALCRRAADETMKRCGRCKVGAVLGAGCAGVSEDRLAAS